MTVEKGKSNISEKDNIFCNLKNLSLALNPLYQKLLSSLGFIILKSFFEDS